MPPGQRDGKPVKEGRSFEKIHPYSAALALLVALGLLGGCNQAASDASASSQEDALSGQQTAASAMDTSSLFSDRDLEGTYDESAAVAIQLSGNSAACDSSAVTVEGSTITITAEGVYLLSGTLTDGQIVVNAGETDKVQLVLKGADITSSTSAAIYALQADKVFVTLAEGSENTLTNGGEYIASDDNNIDGVIFAKTDLTLNGSGSLTLNAQAGHGVVSKDDLVITGGNYTVTAASHGLSAKDSIAIAAGTFAITSGKDGIHAENTEDTSLGYLYLADGSYTITAQGDAISASGAAQIDGGADSSGFGGFGAGPQDAFSASSDSFIVINGGTFTVVSSGDCIDSNGDMTINGGTLDLTCNGAGDTALDCDGTFTHNGGDLTTNDGSEENPGQMGGGGGRGGMGQDGQRPSREPGSLQPPTGDAGDTSTAQ